MASRPSSKPTLCVPLQEMFRGGSQHAEPRTYLSHSSRSVSLDASRQRRMRKRPRRRVRNWSRVATGTRTRLTPRADPAGTAEDVDKLNRRQVKITRQHNDDVRKLLTLMGIPCVTVSWCFRSSSHRADGTLQAPSEAEAQCAELCRGGLVSCVRAA